MPTLDWAWRLAAAVVALGLAAAYGRYGRIPPWAWLAAFTTTAVLLTARLSIGHLTQAEAQVILVAWVIGLAGWALGRLPGVPVKLSLVFTALLPIIRFITLMFVLSTAGSFVYVLLHMRAGAWRWLAAWAGLMSTTLRIPCFDEINATQPAQRIGRGLPIYLTCVAAILYILWWPR